MRLMSPVSRLMSHVSHGLAPLTTSLASGLLHHLYDHAGLCVIANRFGVDPGFIFVFQLWGGVQFQIMKSSDDGLM